MQYLEAGGWIKASALPNSPRIIERLLARGWIDPAERALYRLGLRKKAPLPRRFRSRNSTYAAVELALKAKGPK